MLVFRHLQLRVPYQQPSSLWPWRVSARTAFVSYRQPALLISLPLCSEVFFFLLSAVGMLLFFRSCHNRSIIGKLCSKVSDVFFFLAKKWKQEGPSERGEVMRYAQQIGRQGKMSFCARWLQGMCLFSYSVCIFCSAEKFLKNQGRYVRSPSFLFLMCISCTQVRHCFTLLFLK